MRPSALLSTAAVFACQLANLWHIRAHTYPPTFDDAWYLEISARLYHALRTEGLHAFYQAYADAFLFKAPLIALLPFPFYAVFGISLDSGLLVNSAAMIVLALYVYLLGKRFFGEWEGALAVLITMTLPMLFGISRRFVTEYMLTAFVTAAAYHFLASDGLKKNGQNRILGILLGFGLLAKTLFPFYMLGPVIDILIRRYKELRNRFFQEMEKPAKTILLFAAPIALTWYLHNALYAVGYIFKASFGDIAVKYGPENVFALATIFGYLDKLIGEGPSYFYALAAVAVCAGLFVKERPTWTKLKKTWNGSPALRLVALWLCLPLGVATFGVNKDIRFMTPCLPAFALLLGAGLGRLTLGTRHRVILLTAFFLFPANQYVLHTFGRSLLPEFGIGPIRLLKKNSSYSNPPYAPKFASEEEMARFVDEVFEAVGRRPAAIIFGAESSNLNANNLSYFGALKNYPIKFHNYGYDERRVAYTVARIRDKGADFMLLPEGIPAEVKAEGVALIERQLKELIRTGRLPFAPIRKIRVSEKVEMTLYRRNGEIKMFGAPGLPA